MKPPRYRTLVALAIASFVAITSATNADEAMAGGFFINHDGIMHGSAQGMSLHGIGSSRIVTGDFALSVRGQFRMLSSAKLTRQGPTLATGRPKATPVWVSLVALGEIQLEIPGKAGAPATIHHARTAVYRVSENRWILDSKELE